MAASDQSCPRCGAALRPSDPARQCLQCLLLLALSIDEADITEPAGETVDGEQIGTYKLIRRLGEGGCGVVYLADQHEPVRRQVAVKIIKLGMDTRAVVARFEAEKQVLAVMDHPFIARVYDAGATSSGRPYFVMESVAGQKITDYCDSKKLSVRQRLELFVKVCSAIQHAHQKGVIHRDIKPSNILVTEADDGMPIPKIIDFGIAKATTGQPLTGQTFFTAFEQFFGTPAYMSPEQAGWGELDVDTRTDIYSLGVLLYELLVGKPPFAPDQLSRHALDEVLRLLRDQQPVRPSTRLQELTDEELQETAVARQTAPATLPKILNRDLDWIVLKALEKERARRYATVNAFADDIVRYLDDLPVAASPPSRWRQFTAVVRRHRAAMSLFVALFAAAVGSSVYDTIGYRKDVAASLIALGQIVADNSAAAVAFQRVDEAQYILKACASDPQITQATIYWHGEKFASYPAKNDAHERLDVTPSQKAFTFGWSKITVTIPISRNADMLGALIITSKLKALPESSMVFLLTTVFAPVVYFFSSGSRTRRLRQISAKSL